MKNLFLILICAGVLFSAIGCQVQNNAGDQTPNGEPAAGSNAAQNDRTGTAPENKIAPAAPKPTAEDDGDAKSIYTELTTEKCRTIEFNPDEGGSYKGECPGVGGYKLEVLEGDLRQTINIIYPNGKKYELDFTLNVSGAFSALGEKAEWRVENKDENPQPYAMIVRYNAAENPEKPEQNTSYLVVTKITKDAACITDIVRPSKDQNLTARKLADEAAGKPCIEK